MENLRGFAALRETFSVLMCPDWGECYEMEAIFYSC